MAVFKVFAEKDATIYSELPTTNTGLDEILEVATYYKGTNEYVARSLIQFDSTEVNDVLNSYVSSSTRAATDMSASIRLYLASADELPTDYVIEGYPVYVGSGNTWSQGTGQYHDVPTTTDGVAWANTQSSGSGAWGTTTYVTQSYISGSSPGGGSWYTGSVDYTFDFEQRHTVASTHDLNLDVSDGVKAHYEGTVPNAGFLLKLTGSLEFKEDTQVFLRYFSTDTHTIYPPCLEIKWDDFENDSTLTEVSEINPVIKIKNNRARFTDEGFQKFQLHVRPKYPARTFATSSGFLTNHYLPTASYWGIRDENTEEMVIDFDTKFTKISRDADGNYFTVHMGGLQPERYYRALIKTSIDGSTTILDENLVFKVVRNG